PGRDRHGVDDPGAVVRLVEEDLEVLERRRQVEPERDVVHPVEIGLLLDRRDQHPVDGEDGDQDERGEARVDQQMTPELLLALGPRWRHGLHDPGHRLASRRASPSLRGRRSARTTPVTDSPRLAAAARTTPLTDSPRLAAAARTTPLTDSPRLAAAARTTPLTASPRLAAAARTTPLTDSPRLAAAARTTPLTDSPRLAAAARTTPLTDSPRLAAAARTTIPAASGSGGRGRARGTAAAPGRARSRRPGRGCRPGCRPGTRARAESCSRYRGRPGSGGTRRSGRRA